MFCTSSFRSCKGILKTPALGYAILKEFPVDVPKPAHLCTTSKLFSCMVGAPQTSVMFHRACQSFLKRHTVYCSSSGKSFRTDVPIGTHRFDIRIMIAQMIRAGLVMFDNSLHPDPPHELPQ